MDTEKQRIERLEKQVGQLIRFIANLNERLEGVEKGQREAKSIRVLHKKPKQTI